MFTPAVDEAFEWFDQTYRIAVGLGWVGWEREALPYEGGLADQPAKLIETLMFIADLRNSLIARERRRHPRGQKPDRG